MIAGERGACAELRVEAQAIAREAELADRRLQAIAGERAGWSERRDGAATQIAHARASAACRRPGPSARSLDNAPQIFAAEAPVADRRDRARGSGAPGRRRSAGRGRERARRSRSGRPRRARGDRRSAREAPPAAKSAAKPPSVGSPTSTTRSARRSRSSRRRSAELAEIKPGAELPRPSRSKKSSTAFGANASGSAPSTCAPRRSSTRSKRSTQPHHRARRPGRGDPRLRQGIQSLNREARERLLTSFEVVNRPLQEAVRRAVRRRHRRAAADRERGSARSRPRNHGQAARQEAGDAVAALGRRAGADRAGADLRRVPHQPGADLRARRGRRAARRLQRRALLRPARRDDAARPTPASSSSPTIRSPWRG